MKILHHNDMDGRSAAAIAGGLKYWSLRQRADDSYESLSAEEKTLLTDYETKSVFVECDYASHPANSSLVSDGERVIIVDLSFSEKTLSSLKEICAKASEVIWLDHHLTSKQLVESGAVNDIPNLHYVVEMNKSGAYLAWDYFVDSYNVPDFVKLVSDYDCWIMELGDRTIFFKCGIDMCEHDPMAEVWKTLITEACAELGIETDYDLDGVECHPYKCMSVINDGRTAKRYIDYQNRSYFKNYAFKSDVFGVDTICVNWRTNSWVFGDAYYEAPLCCVFAFNGDKWVYSLYSHNESIDCSAIAKRYGGGGHRGAAGFSLKYCLFGNQPNTLIE